MSVTWTDEWLMTVDEVQERNFVNDILNSDNDNSLIASHKRIRR